MNLTSSHLFWSVNNGLPPNYPSLQRNVSCDAVVIGGEILRDVDDVKGVKSVKNQMTSGESK